MTLKNKTTKLHPSIWTALIFPLLLIITSGIPLLGRADDYHYRNVLLGERGAGMGGAYLAISDDPTGIFYNPAGMVFGYENYMSASASTYTSSRLIYKNVLAKGDYTYRSESFAPSFIGFSQNIGKHKLALGILIPNYELVDQDDLIRGISTTTDRANELKRRFFNQDITYQAGPAYSMALGEKTSLGISLLGFAKLNTLISTQLVLDNPLPNGKYFIEESYLTETILGLTPKIGFQAMLTQSLAIGLTAKKNYTLSGKSSQRLLKNKLNATTGIPEPKTGGFQDDFSTETRDFNSRVVAPYEFGFGTAYFFNRNFLVAADLIYSTADPDFTGFKVTPTLNWSAGAEWYVTDGFALRGGLFSNMANTPAINTQLKNQAPHVDLYGASLGLSLLKTGSSVTLGAQYSYGSGKGQAFGDSLLVQEVIQSQMSLFLSGSYQI
jgi:long-chain fatty acid transport protein